MWLNTSPTLSPPTVNMMLNNDRHFYVARQVILITTALMFSVITTVALVILPRPTQIKFSHQEHLISMTDYTPDHITTTIVRDRSQSLHCRHCQRRCFHRSGSHHWYQCSRSSSNYQRHASYSPSHHQSSSQYPFTRRQLKVTLSLGYTTPTQLWLIYDMQLFILESLLWLLYGLQLV